VTTALGALGARSKPACAKSRGGGDNATVASSDGQAAQLVRWLELRVGFVHDWQNADFLRVKILIDGEDPLTEAGPRAPYWGPSPSALLEEASPLMPADPPRRVSLYSEGTMDPGEGNITAIISVAGRHVIWADFRECPADASLDRDEMIFDLRPARSSPLSVPDLVFDREQYLGEVRRAITEREWESDRWRTALLLDEYLGLAIRARPDLSDADFYPYYAEPADGDDAGVLVTLWNDEFPEQGVVVAVTAGPGTPEQRARAMTDALMEVPSERWPVIQRMQQPR
jgi:hypothetical protein